MVPRNGGEELEESPICLGGDHLAAKAYVWKLEKAIDQTGWSRGQRARIQQLLSKWRLRAQGWDGQFERYGTFGRKPGSPPPKPVDVVLERWRRAERQRVRCTAQSIVERQKKMREWERRKDKEAEG